ncbi:hypothetical protein ABZ924_01910 [Streptomyces sp. NPDC046876]|uniref:hypothetical protein n=1 Tax=Streptomyces sp. NPDC046876 TaxID=3155616 RepID=UPI0033DEFE4A
MHGEEGHDQEQEAVGIGCTDLGALLLDLATVIEAAVEAEAERDVVAALTTEPAAQALAGLTDRLITHCKTLAVGLGEIPPPQRSARAVGALRDWADLASGDPAAEARQDRSGNLAYARLLALLARTMLRALREHRAKPRQRAPHPAT